MTNSTGTPQQFALFGVDELNGQLPITDYIAECATAERAAAELERHDMIRLEQHGGRYDGGIAAVCSCGWESGLHPGKTDARSSHRAHQLEAAAAQGRADVAAGLDPFAGDSRRAPG